jgi:hypothetical protein
LEPVGLLSGLLSEGLYSSVVRMVIITTFFAPPLLRQLLKRQPGETLPGVGDFVVDAISDGANDEA